MLRAQADRQELLEFALKLMLHPPVRQQDPSNPLQAGALAQRGLGPLTAPAQVGGSIAALPRPTGVLHGAGGAQIGGVSALGPLPGEADAPGAVDADEDMGVDGPGIEPADSEGMAVGPVAPGLSSEDMETITKVCLHDSKCTLRNVRNASSSMPATSVERWNRPWVDAKAFYSHLKLRELISGTRPCRRLAVCLQSIACAEVARECLASLSQAS